MGGVDREGQQGKRVDGGMEKLRVLTAVQVTPLGVYQSSLNRSVKQVTLNCV